MQQGGEGRGGVVLPLVPRRNTEAVRPGGEPLPELWRRWWQDWGNFKRPATQKTYARCETLSRSLGPFPCVSEVRDWYAALASGGHGAQAVGARRSQLLAVYNFARDAGWSSGVNPVALAKWDPGPPAEVAPIGDIARLWPRLLSACQDARERAFLGVFRFAGLRLKEALALRELNVLRSCEPWLLSVTHQRPSPADLDTLAPVKGRRQKGKRKIPMRAGLRELLRPLLDYGPVQVTVGGGQRGGPTARRAVDLLFPYRQHELNDLLARLREVAPGYFPRGRAWHVFRHTVAYELAGSGKQVSEVQNVLGHESILHTSHYMSRLVGSDIPSGVFDGLD